MAIAASIIVHGLWLGYLPGLKPHAAPAATPLSVRLVSPPPPAPAPAVQQQAPAAASMFAPPRAAGVPVGKSTAALHPVSVPAAPFTGEDSDPGFSVRAEAPSPPPAALALPPSRPAAAAPPDPALLTGYGRELAGAIARLQRYPRIAQLRQWQGTVVVQLQLADDGKLAGARVLSSSGHDILDHQALEMVRAAVPLPPMPATLAGRPLTVDVPVVFRLAG